MQAHPPCVSAPLHPRAEDRLHPRSRRGGLGTRRAAGTPEAGFGAGLASWAQHAGEGGPRIPAALQQMGGARRHPAPLESAEKFPLVLAEYGNTQTLTAAEFHGGSRAPSHLRVATLTLPSPAQSVWSRPASDPPPRQPVPSLP